MSDMSYSARLYVSSFPFGSTAQFRPKPPQWNFVSLQLLDRGESVRILERVISSSQGLYLYIKTEKRTHNTNTKHSYPGWDSSPRSRRPREGRQFMPYTARLPWPASMFHYVEKKNSTLVTLDSETLKAMSSLFGRGRAREWRPLIKIAQTQVWRLFRTRFTALTTLRNLAAALEISH
jgi:hypothetical protein